MELRADSADLVIVSAFGRGNWLASELASKGWRVTLVDTSEALGEADLEDTEGPFGLFEAADVSANQKTRFEDEGGVVRTSGGFTVWLGDGPLEGHSALTTHQIARFGLHEGVETYLRHSNLPDRDSDRARRVLGGRSFHQLWLAHLAHQVTSPVVCENHLALGPGHFAPIFSPLTIRQPTSDGRHKALKIVQAAGAKVRPRASIEDIRFVGKQVDAIEVHGEGSGVERGREYLWMLSSLETQKFSDGVYQTLYPKGALEPDWYWTRYRLTVSGGVSDDQLPHFAVAIDDIHLPWTHANMMIVRRAREARTLDIWIRLPIWARTDRAYLDGMRTEIEKLIAKRIPGSQPKTVLTPREMREELGVAGPPRWPLRGASGDRLTTMKASNLTFCGPEQWETLDWLGAYRKQVEVYARLDKLRNAWIAKAEREAAKRMPKDNRTGGPQA